MNKIISILIVCIFIACTSSNKGNVKQEEGIGQFLYLDQYNCLHTNRNCVMLLIGGETENSSHTNYPVTFIEVKQIRNLDGFKFCSDCFTDELYDKLQHTIQNNDRQSDVQDTAIDGETLKKDILQKLENVKRVE